MRESTQRLECGSVLGVRPSLGKRGNICGLRFRFACPTAVLVAGLCSRRNLPEPLPTAVLRLADLAVNK